MRREGIERDAGGKPVSTVFAKIITPSWRRRGRHAGTITIDAILAQRTAPERRSCKPVSAPASTFR